LEIVVLELADGTGVRYLKRIVGLPGDRIEIRDRVLYRNGEPVAEPYIRPLDNIHFYGRNFGATTVEAGKAFVLADNRDNRSAPVLSTTRTPGEEPFLYRRALGQRTITHETHL
jgi:signal peptidase I